MSGERKLSKMSGGEGFVLFCQNVRRGIHGSLVKMSGEAQNHLLWAFASQNICLSYGFDIGICHIILLGGTTIQGHIFWLGMCMSV